MQKMCIISSHPGLKGMLEHLNVRNRPSPYDLVRLPEGPPSPVDGWEQIRTWGELRRICSIWYCYLPDAIRGTRAFYTTGAPSEYFGIKCVEGLWVFNCCEGADVRDAVIEGLGGDYRLALSD
jgi:hypothetical protein